MNKKNIILSVSILNTLIEVVIGAIIYIGILIIMKYKFLYDIMNQFLNSAKNILKPRKEI